MRESTETEKETEARRFLKDREGSAVKGQPIVPRVERILYEEAAADLGTHYRATGERDLTEAGWRLTHLEAFFRTKRISSIGSADVTRYIAARQEAGASNGTINRELAARPHASPRLREPKADAAAHHPQAEGSQAS